MQTLQQAASEEEIANQKMFLQLSEWANKLLEMGVNNIYQETYESLLKNMNFMDGKDDAAPAEDASAASAASAAPPVDDGGLWEYVMPGSSDVQGPFTAAEMNSWRQQGYFVGEYTALVRPHGSTSAPPSSSSATAAAEAKAAAAAASAAAAAPSAADTTDELMADLDDSDDDEVAEEKPAAAAATPAVAAPAAGPAAGKEGWVLSTSVPQFE